MSAASNVHRYLALASVTSGNSPYTTLYNNDLVEVTDSGLSVVFLATPFVGQQITVIWSATAGGVVGPLITSSGGFGIEDVNALGTILAAGTNTQLNSLYQRATWEFDGTNWRSIRPVVGQKTQVFLTSGTFTVPANVYVLTLDGSGGGGGGGGAAPGVIGAGAQNGGGGGAGAAPCHLVVNTSPGASITITIGAGGTAGTGGTFGGAAGTNGGNGGDTIIGSLGVFPGAAGGEYGGTPAAGTAAGGGTSNDNVGVNRIPPGNPSWTGPGFGGWGGSTAGPVGHLGVQNSGADGQKNSIAWESSTLFLAGIGGVQGATNTNPGGCGGGGGGAGLGAINTSTSSTGGNGRIGGAGSAAGAGANGPAGLTGSGHAAGGGGGGAGGNGATAGGNGGNGATGTLGSLAITWITSNP